MLPVSLEGLIRLKGTVVEAWEQQRNLMAVHSARAMHGEMLVKEIHPSQQLLQGGHRNPLP